MIIPPLSSMIPPLSFWLWKHWLTPTQVKRWKLAQNARRWHSPLLTEAMEQVLFHGYYGYETVNHRKRVCNAWPYETNRNRLGIPEYLIPSSYDEWWDEFRCKNVTP